VLTTILCILAGIPIGFLLRNKQTAVKAINRLTMWVIYVLLFALGVTTCANETIVNQLGEIGGRAACISLFSVLGSACAVYLLGKFVMKDQFDER